MVTPRLTAAIPEPVTPTYDDNNNNKYNLFTLLLTSVISVDINKRLYTQGWAPASSFALTCHHVNNAKTTNYAWWLGVRRRG